MPVLARLLLIARFRYERHLSRISLSYGRSWYRSLFYVIVILRYFTMIMYYIATVLFTVLHVHLHVSAEEHIDVSAALQQAYLYTNFCNKNASSYIQDGRQAPCCRECSCNDDCWKRGNCCPDKIARDKGLAYEHETCKDTQVSSAGITTANGLSQNRRRYFVTETCPETMEDDFVKEKCTGIVAETLTDLLWVSDPDTNRIYRNKFCTKCHGIRKYQEWQISTNCLKLLLMENYTQNIRAYPGCRLSVITPNRNVFDNQCLVPDISTCNETGLWQTKDNITETLCNSHSLMFVKQYMLHSRVYRNVFCFKCNSPQEHPLRTFVTRLTWMMEHETTLHSRPY